MDRRAKAPAPERTVKRPQAEARGRPLGIPVVIVLVWALLTVVAVVGIARGPSPWSGALEGLVPAEHRDSEPRSLVILRVDFDGLSGASEAEPGAAKEAQEEKEVGAETDPRTVLAEAGIAIEEAFADERVPLAPPRTEITRWLDAHALYLLPVETHAALAARLTDEAMLAQVQGLRARLSSPLFAVSGEQPRRDPLALHELTAREAGRLGHVAELPGSRSPMVSPSGDLIAASGDRALVALVTSRPRDEIETTLAEALDGQPVTSQVVVPRARELALAEQLRHQWAKLLIACLAGLVLVLVVVMRKVVPVLALGACLGSAWAMLVWLGPKLGPALASLGPSLAMLDLDPGAMRADAGMDLASSALAVILLGVGVDGALRLPAIARRAWVAPAIFACALAPLWLTPYPLWRIWALRWALALGLVTVIVRVVLPALVELLRGELSWRRRSFRLTPTPIVAVAVGLVLTGAGLWLAPQLPYRSLARLPIDDPATRAAARELSEHFFDPTMIVEARSRPAPGERPPELETAAAGALDAAAGTAAALAPLVPDLARRVDSPGSFVLPHAELETRRAALSKLDLDQRMEVLELQLEDRGLRAEAFAEFVRGAADIDDLPSAQAALDGPLGPWISSYLVATGEDEVELRTRIELRGSEGLTRTELTWTEEGPELGPEELAGLPPLHGPAMAALIDRGSFMSHLGLAVAAGLWLGALFVWLGTGSLAQALACAWVGLCCELGVVIALALLDQSFGPHLLPALLFVGAAATVAGGRACRAASLAEPIAASGLLLAAGCQVVAGLVLLASPQPLWRELGLAFAIGSALASGLGLFVTPGLARVFGGFVRRQPSQPNQSNQPNQPNQQPESTPDD